VKRLSRISGLADVQSEVASLVEVQTHPNVVRFHCLFASYAPDGEEDLNIVLDYASGGDLFNLCVVRGPLSEVQAAPVLRDVLAALAHVHAAGVVHRDVKPENVLLMADGRAVLADFGVATRVVEGEQLVLRYGSLGYAAPEVLRGMPYGPPVDCFGAGGILHFMLAGVPPFTGRDSNVVALLTCHCKIDFTAGAFKRASTGCLELLKGLLCGDPKMRLTAARAGEHRWLPAVRPTSTAKKFPEDGEEKGCALHWALKSLFRWVSRQSRRHRDATGGRDDPDAHPWGLEVDEW